MDPDSLSTTAIVDTSGVRRNTTFTLPLDTLPQLDLSLTLNIHDWSLRMNEFMNQYGPGSNVSMLSKPYAKVSEGEKYKAYIFISIDETGSPLLVTMDHNGKQIDGLSLQGDWSSNDPENWTTEVATINRDLSIELLDSAWAFELDSAEQRRQSSGKLTVTRERYQLRDDGTFALLERSVDR